MKILSSLCLLFFTLSVTAQEPAKPTETPNRSGLSMASTTVVLASGSSGSYIASKGMEKKSIKAELEVEMLQTKLKYLQPRLEEATKRLGVLEALDSNNITQADLEIIGASNKIYDKLPFELGYGERHAIYYQEVLNNKTLIAKAQPLVTEMRSLLIGEYKEAHLGSEEFQKAVSAKANEIRASELQKQYEAIVKEARELPNAVSYKILPLYGQQFEGANTNQIGYVLSRDDIRFRGFVDTRGNNLQTANEFTLGIRRELGVPEIQQLLTDVKHHHAMHFEKLRAEINAIEMQKAAVLKRAGAARSISKGLRRVGHGGVVATVGSLAIGYFSAQRSTSVLLEETEPNVVESLHPKKESP